MKLVVKRGPKDGGSTPWYHATGHRSGGMKVEAGRTLQIYSSEFLVLGRRFPVCVL